MDILVALIFFLAVLVVFLIGINSLGKRTCFLCHRSFRSPFSLQRRIHIELQGHEVVCRPCAKTYLAARREERQTRVDFCELCQGKKKGRIYSFWYGNYIGARGYRSGNSQVTETIFRIGGKDLTFLCWACVGRRMLLYASLIVIWAVAGIVMVYVGVHADAARQPYQEYQKVVGGLLLTVGFMVGWPLLLLKTVYVGSGLAIHMKKKTYAARGYRQMFRTDDAYRLSAGNSKIRYEWEKWENASGAADSEAQQATAPLPPAPRTGPSEGAR